MPVASLSEHATHEGTDSHGPASLLARIEQAIYRLQNTHGLPLQPLGDGSDPEVVLRDCATDHVHMRRALCGLREAVLEQVGKDQTDRLIRMTWSARCENRDSLGEWQQQKARRVAGLFAASSVTLSSLCVSSRRARVAPGRAARACPARERSKGERPNDHHR